MDPTKTETPEASKTEQDAHLDQVAGNMSKVNPDVIARQEVEKTAAQMPQDERSTPSPAPQPLPSAKEVKGLRDRRGRKFDPAYHELDGSGHPRLNRDGFLFCKGGRPGKFKQAHAAQVPESERIPPTDPQAAAPATDREATDRKATAAFSAAMFINLGVGIFGEEWLPMKNAAIDEQADLTDKFDAWYKQMGISDLPPGVALAVGLLGYAAVRLYKPNTQTRMKILVGMIKNSIGRFFGGIFGFFKKLFKGARANASHVNLRDHGERKDNAGAKAGEALPPQGDSGPRS